MDPEPCDTLLEVPVPERWPDLSDFRSLVRFGEEPRRSGVKRVLATLFCLLSRHVLAANDRILDPPWCD